MVLLEKLWDDVAGGVHPDHGLGRLRKLSTRPISLEGIGEGESSKFQKSLSMPLSPATPTTPTAAVTPTARKDNVWRSVFHPGSNIATKTMGAHQMFDKPSPNSPTVYDWLYSGETRSNHR